MTGRKQGSYPIESKEGKSKRRMNENETLTVYDSGFVGGGKHDPGCLRPQSYTDTRSNADTCSAHVDAYSTDSDPQTSGAD
jgi:hypothetical protein